MLDEQVYRAVKTEQFKLEGRLDSGEYPLSITHTEIDHLKVLVTIHVLAPEKTARAVIVDSTGDYFAELRDEERTLCANFISDILNNFHYRCKKGYIPKPCAVTYYLQPDWKYFNDVYGKPKPEVFLAKKT